MPDNILFDPGSSLIVVTGEKFYTPTASAQQVRGDSDICQELVDAGYASVTPSNESTCNFSSSYESGDTLKGFVVVDSVAVDVANGERPSIPLVFGVDTTSESAAFDGGSLEGGIAGNDRGESSLMRQLYAQGVISHDAFGQCGTGPLQNGSFSVFGPYVPDSKYSTTQLYSGKELNGMNDMGEEFDETISFISPEDSGYYVLFSGVEVNGTRIQDASYSPVPIIFDTGNPSMIIPPEYFDGVASYVNDTVAALGDAYTFVSQPDPDIGDSILVIPSSGVLDPSVVPDIFPYLDIILGRDGDSSAIKVTIPPEAYVTSGDIGDSQGFSVKLSAIGTGSNVNTQDGLNLGSVIVYEKFVQINANASTMAISESTPGCIFAKNQPAVSPSMAPSPPDSHSPTMSTLFGRFILILLTFMNLLSLF